MIYERISVTLLLFLCILLAFSSLHAQENALYGISGNNKLIRINLPIGPGSEQVVGPISLADVQDIAYDPVTQITYCVAANGEVCTLNLNTGIATLIGSISVIDVTYSFRMEVDRTGPTPLLYITDGAASNRFLRADISNPALLS